MIRWSPTLPTRPGCPHSRLRRLLLRELPEGLAPGASIFRPWASASFVGARHIFPFTVSADDNAEQRHALQDKLNAIEWPLPGHIVADIVVGPGADAGALLIEILTVED
ncbi:MAG: hypothetical protein Q7T68_01625 [Sphingopyxis sp.]|nr:hypothetical protein [Sphingopyxis sp.]